MNFPHKMIVSLIISGVNCQVFEFRPKDANLDRTSYDYAEVTNLAQLIKHTKKQ